VRASKKLRGDELLLTNFAGTRLRMELDRIPLWRGDHVEVKQLAEDFARYVYLPRLKDPPVLLYAIGDGVSLLSWERDGFAFADSFDEIAGRYRGLRVMQRVDIGDPSSPALVVKPEVARRQLDAESVPKPGDGLPPTKPDPGGEVPPKPGKGKALPPEVPKPQPKRFHGAVGLDATRVGRDASKIADEVISHLVGLVGADVKVTLEIEAEIRFGVPDNVVRVVTENARTLKFTSQGFEKE
jgi:hypothetical protein